MTGKVNIDSVKNIAYDADAADADADADDDDDAHKMITLKKRKRDIQLNENVLIFLLIVLTTAGGKKGLHSYTPPVPLFCMDPSYLYRVSDWPKGS